MKAVVVRHADAKPTDLGGGVSRAGQLLIDGIEPYFRRLVSVNVRFRIATLGNDAGVYGSFKLLLDSMDQ